MNRHTFDEHMKLLAATWPDRSPSADTMAAYWLALNDLDDEVFSRAIGSVLRRSTFFPAPAEIRKAAEEAMTAMGVAPPEPDRAWELVLRAASGVGFREAERQLLDHPSIKRAVQEMGGSRSIAMSDRSDEPFLRKRFVERYAVYRRRELDGETGWFGDALPGGMTAINGLASGEGDRGGEVAD